MKKKTKNNIFDHVTSAHYGLDRICYSCVFLQQQHQGNANQVQLFEVLKSKHLCEMIATDMSSSFISRND